MSPGGSNYAVKIGISISGDQQLNRVLDNIKQLKTEVSGLAAPLGTIEGLAKSTAVSMGLLADNSKAAARGIQSLITQLNKYIDVAQKAQNIPAIAPGSGLQPSGGGGAGGTGGGGRNIGSVFARIGGRLGGQFSSIPGGGFIGAQTIGALG